MRNAPPTKQQAPTPAQPEALLEQLLAPPAGRAAPSPLAPAAPALPAAPARKRKSGTAYDRITRRLGLLVGLGVMAGLWLTGGYFTLSWVHTLGVAFAGESIALIDSLLRSDTTLEGSVAVALLGWCIPAAITVAEVGLWPTRVPHPFSWLVWMSFLLLDAGTTAAGIVPFLTYDVTTNWAIGLGLGAILAIVPEKGVRYLWSLLKEA